MTRSEKVLRRQLIKGAGAAALSLGVVSASPGSPPAYHGGAAEAAVGPANQSPTLAKILRDGAISVGIKETIPNAWRDTKSGEWVGYNTAVARQLATDLNVKLDLVEATEATWIPQLHEGKFAIHMLGWFMTAQRAVQVDFTQPVYIKGYSVIVRKESPVKTMEQLNDSQYSVTGVVGGAEEVVAKTYFPKAKTNFLNTTGPLTASLEVKVGRSTAWIYPSDVIQAFLAQNSWARLLNPAPIWNNPLAYAIRKGDPEWKFFMDAYITHLKDGGLLSKWIDEADRAAYRAMSAR